MKKSNILLIITLLLFVNCDINMTFKGEDKNWANIYKTKDVLIFTSKKSHDTIYINRAETKNTNVDLMVSNFNPICTSVDYNGLNNKVDNMFVICKEEPSTPVWIGFNFKNDKGRIRDIHSYPESVLYFNGEKRKGYMFKPYKKDKPSFWWNEEYGLENPNLTYFFWDKEFGIIEFETITGEVFKLEEFLRDGVNIMKK